MSAAGTGDRALARVILQQPSLFVLIPSEAEVFVLGTPYAILAATNRDLTDASYAPSSSYRRVLRLKFNDIQHQCCSRHRLFEDEHAKQIVEFAHWFPDNAMREVVVHCERGIFRSSAPGRELPLIDEPFGWTPRNAPAMAAAADARCPDEL